MLPNVFVTTLAGLVPGLCVEAGDVVDPVEMDPVIIGAAVIYCSLRRASVQTLELLDSFPSVRAGIRRPDVRAIRWLL